jgi:HEAT repeat protein
LVSVFAVKALGRVTAHSEVVLLALTDALRHPHAKVRSEAAFALGRSGPRAIIATENLSALLTDEYEHVRIAATNSLLIIAPEVLTNAPPQ